MCGFVSCSRPLTALSPSTSRAISKRSRMRMRRRLAPPSVSSRRPRSQSRLPGSPRLRAASRRCLVGRPELAGCTPPFTGSPRARGCEHSFPRRSPRVPHCPAIPLRARATCSCRASAVLAVRRPSGLPVVLRPRAPAGTALRCVPVAVPSPRRHCVYGRAVPPCAPFPRAVPVVLLPGPHPPGAVGLLSSGAAPERHRRSVLLPVAW